MLKLIPLLLDPRKFQRPHKNIIVVIIWSMLLKQLFESSIINQACHQDEAGIIQIYSFVVIKLQLRVNLGCSCNIYLYVNDKTDRLIHVTQERDICHTVQ